MTTKFYGFDTTGIVKVENGFLSCLEIYHRGIVFKVVAQSSFRVVNFEGPVFVFFSGGEDLLYRAASSQAS